MNMTATPYPDAEVQAKAADSIADLQPVPRELAYLRQSIDRLMHQCGLLTEKVEPVLRPDNVEAMVASRLSEISNPTCDVAQQIAHARSHVDDVADRLARCAERVEV